VTDSPSARPGDDNYLLVTLDAVGGEPVAIMAGECHVQILTWHGVAKPHTVGNAQVAYLTSSAGYQFGEALAAAADEVVNNSIDRSGRFDQPEAGA